MWFCKKMTECAQCRMFFAPYVDSEPFKIYCPAHREPKLDAWHREQRILDWARRNLDKVGALCDAEMANERAAMHAYASANFVSPNLNAAMAQAQNRATAPGGLGDLANSTRSKGPQ